MHVGLFADECGFRVIEDTLSNRYTTSAEPVFNLYYFAVMEAKYIPRTSKHVSLSVRWNHLRSRTHAISHLLGIATRLAWYILAADRKRTSATIAGVAVSYFLMVYQVGLILGFLAAAGHIVRASGADVWVSAGKTPCVEFGATISDSIADGMRGIVGVDRVARIVVGFAHWLGPQGQHRSVTLVAAEDLPHSTLPTATSLTGYSHALSELLVVDFSALDNLGITKMPLIVEVNDHRAILEHATNDFSSFLGAPYAFASYEDARAWLNVPPTQTMFLGLSISAWSDRIVTLHKLRTRYPELQILSAEDFASKSGLYWMTATGAGGGLALAGILGLVIGALVISQTLYALTASHLDEFATLGAIGATPDLPKAIVLTMAWICALGGIACGMLLLIPMIAFTRAFVVAWIVVPAWLLAACFLVTIVVAALASRGSLSAINGVDPVRVFRN